MGKFGILLTVVVPAALLPTAFAASDQAAIESTFVRPWVQALRSRDKARIEKFFHPATRACINASTRVFFNSILDQEADATTAKIYHIAQLAPLTGAPPAILPQDGFQYPLKPVYQINVDFEGGDDLIRFLAPSNGSWFEVYPCPNAKGMVYFRQQAAEGMAQRKKVAQLVASLKDPLRAQLKILLQSQQKIEAVKRFSAASHVDLGTSLLVIDALEQSQR
jgi:hypothetical protein